MWRSGCAAPAASSAARPSAMSRPNSVLTPRDPGVAPQVVHEVGEVPPEKIDFCEVAIEADELRARPRVDLQPAARGVQRALELGAHAPPQRDGRLQDREARERVPALVVEAF